MTTTSYPLDGKAGTNIGKTMTDSSTHRLIEVRLAPISGEKADMLEGPSCAMSCREQMQQRRAPKARLLDHLVGESKQPVRNGEVERLTLRVQPSCPFAAS
jgi:hypothetical protein